MGCFKIGADSALTNPNVKGIWFKTHVTRQAGHLVATTYVVSGGDLQVFKAEVDLASIARSLKASDVVGAWYNPIDQVNSAYSKVSRLGKSKLARQVWNTTKSVVNNNITRGLVAATAVVFPPVGIPALAALSAATVAVNAIEDGRKVAQDSQKLVQRLGSDKRQKAQLGRFAAKHGRPALDKYLGKNPAVVEALKKGEALRSKVKTQLTPERKAELAKTLRKAELAKSFLRRVDHQAHFGNGPAKSDAQKFRAIVLTVATTKAKVKSLTQELSGGIPGILIDATGSLRGGSYVLDPRGGTPDVLVTPKGMKPGTYRAITLDPEKVQRLKLLQAQVNKTGNKTSTVQKVLEVKKKLDAKAAVKAKVLANVKSLPPAKKKELFKKLVNAKKARSLKVSAVKSKIAALPPAKKSQVVRKIAQNLKIVKQAKAQQYVQPSALISFP